MEEENQVFRVSVRMLVEFILRSGDLDQRRGAMPDKDAMQLGSRLHRKIQGRMGSGYRAEVPLSGLYKSEDFSILVEGRADGIFEEDGRTVIDEIKGILRDLKFLEKPVEVHLAQAKCYAYLYACMPGTKPDMDVQMTYVNLRTEEIRRFRFSYSFEELETWYNGILSEYEKWMRYERDWKNIRTASIKKTEFPFPYREGQRRLVASVYRTIVQKRKIFIQAPTGSGKTLAAVFPAVRAMGEGYGDRLFYLTAKTITRTVAMEAFSILKKKGLEFKVITLTAKEKICPMETTECNPESCPRAKGHFDRINAAVFDCITNSTSFDRKAMEEWAERYQVCPFEFSLDVSVWLDGIICDYNYVFDPRAHLKRFFAEGVKGDYLFLIDEAHNLVDRGREMFSAELFKEDFLELKKAVSPFSKSMSRALERCNRHLLEYKRTCEGCQVLPNPGTFPVALLNLAGVMEEFMEDSGNPKLNEQVLELYFPVRTFLDTCELLDDCYVIYTQFEPDGRFMIRLFCVDPSYNLQACMERGRSTVFFSATLIPLDYYHSLLSREEDYSIYANSSFDPAMRGVFVGRDLSSRYTNRGPGLYKKIAEYIRAMVTSRQGNYMVFFPSYQMLEDVASVFEPMLPSDCELLCQHSGMKEDKREEFLAAFSTGRSDSLVGFCVMGSAFGEGIDLRHDRLIGAAIVGTGLPQVGNEREILKSFYNNRGMDGFRYAYLCPGINKVLQAAGRVIRTKEDVGVVLLLDVRFTWEAYRQMFPPEWTQIMPVSLDEIPEKLENFWEMHKGYAIQSENPML